jgi:hypothetical protein
MVKERVELYLYSISGPRGLFYGELYHLPLIAVVAANIHYEIIEVMDFLSPLLCLESTCTQHTQYLKVRHMFYVSNWIYISATDCLPILSLKTVKRCSAKLKKS